MISEILALMVAVVWAFPPLLYRKALPNVSYLAANLVRSAFGALFLLCVFLATFHQFPSVPFGALSLLFLAGITNLVIGDTLFFISLRRVGISRTQPITSSYPLFSMILAGVLLGEGITLSIIVGTPMIVLGIAIVSLTGNENNKTPHCGAVPFLAGTPYALGSAFCYAVGFIVYKFAMVDGSIDPIFATCVRYLVIIPTLMILVMIEKPDRVRSLGKRDVVRLAIGGILEVGIGGTLMFVSLKLGNASTTIPLMSATPLFTLVLAAQYAGEKMSLRLLIGTVITVAGIVMVASSAMV